MRCTIVFLISLAYLFGAALVAIAETRRLPPQGDAAQGPAYDQAQFIDDHYQPIVMADQSDGFGWFASAELLIMRANRRGMDYAILDPDGDADVEGRVLGLDNELPYDAGFRVSIGATLGLQDQIDFTYLRFAQNVSATALEPPGGRIWIPVMPPDQTQNYTRSDATYELTLNAYDVMYRRTIGLMGATARVYGGVRIADVKQRFDVLASVGGGGLNPEDTYNTFANFSGAGPRLGLGFERRLFGNIFFIGDVSGSLLLGKFDTGVFLADDGNLEIDISQEFSQTVPVADVEVGLLWQPVFLDGWRFAFGWQQMNWFNMAPVQQFVEDGGNDQGTFVDLGHDLSLSAFFARVEFWH